MTEESIPSTTRAAKAGCRALTGQPEFLPWRHGLGEGSFHAVHDPYTRSDGSPFAIGYEEARKRLFALSFDPYQCVERRWGAALVELSTCPYTVSKATWYEAQQYLRNQIDRTYEAEIDFTAVELKTPGPGKGASAPPDIDVRGFLGEAIKEKPEAMKSAASGF